MPEDDEARLQVGALIHGQQRVHPLPTNALHVEDLHLEPHLRGHGRSLRAKVLGRGDVAGTVLERACEVLADGHRPTDPEPLRRRLATCSVEDQVDRVDRDHGRGVLIDTRAQLREAPGGQDPALGRRLRGHREVEIPGVHVDGN